MAQAATSQEKGSAAGANAQQPAPAASVVAKPDPAAWGVLARLAGYRWQSADGVVHVFEWSADGREIVESERVGGVLHPVNVFAMEGDRLVQRRCLGTSASCILFHKGSASIAADGSVLFRAYSAVGKKKSIPRVILEERPDADWKQWRRKYSDIHEAVTGFRLEGPDRLVVTESFNVKSTSEPAEASWGDPGIKPPVSYTRVGPLSATDAAGKNAPDFGAMEVFVGKRMIAEDGGELLELQHAPDGSLVIQWFTYAGQKLGRFEFAASATEANKLELRDYPYPNSQSLAMRKKLVNWLQGGVLFFMIEPEVTSLTELFQFSMANGKLRLEKSAYRVGTTFTGKPTVENFSSGARTFVPATPELIAAAVAANERRLEAERRQADLAAENRRAQEAQRQQSAAAFMGGLNAFAQGYTSAMNQSQQMEDRMRSGYREAIREGNRQFEARAAEPAPANTAQPRAVESAAAAPAPAAKPARSSAAVASTAARQDSSGRSDSGEARTSDDDPMTCLGGAVTYPNPSYKGATVAKVTNTCKRKVDMRICLLKDTGKWTCGMGNGIAPGSYHSYWGYTTGEVFVDARYSGDDKKLTSPPAR